MPILAPLGWFRTGSSRPSALDMIPVRRKPRGFKRRLGTPDTGDVCVCSQDTQHYLESRPSAKPTKQRLSTTQASPPSGMLSALFAFQPRPQRKRCQWLQPAVATREKDDKLGNDPSQLALRLQHRLLLPASFVQRRTRFSLEVHAVLKSWPHSAVQTPPHVSSAPDT